MVVSGWWVMGSGWWLVVGGWWVVQVLTRDKMKINLDTFLSAKTENEVLEFKEAKQSFSKDRLGKYFSALGNEANLNGKEKAYLLFGVNDKRNIVGTSISDKALNEYKKEIADHTSPSLSFLNIHRINTV